MVRLTFSNLSVPVRRSQELTERVSQELFAVHETMQEGANILYPLATGKTTTMGMLTAEFPPSEGDATLASFSVSREPQKTRRRVGYCPQFDAHFASKS